MQVNKLYFKYAKKITEKKVAYIKNNNLLCFSKEKSMSIEVSLSGMLQALTVQNAVWNSEVTPKKKKRGKFKLSNALIQNLSSNNTSIIKTKTIIEMKKVITLILMIFIVKFSFAQAPAKNVQQKPKENIYVFSLTEAQVQALFYALGKSNAKHDEEVVPVFEVLNPQYISQWKKFNPAPAAKDSSIKGN